MKEMIRTPWLPAIAALLAAGALACGGSSAAEPDPQAEATLGEAVAWLAERDSIAFRLTLNMHQEMQGLTQELTDIYDVTARRPDRFALRPRSSSMMAVTLVYDGAEIHSHMAMMNQYSSAPATFTLTDLGGPDSPVEMASPFASSLLPFITPILAADPDGQALENMTAVYVGEEEVNGVACRRLRLTYDTADMSGMAGHDPDMAMFMEGLEGIEADVWIESGATPVPRKAFFDMSKMMEASAKAMAKMAEDGDTPMAGMDMGPMAAMMREMKITIEVHYDDWQADPTLADDAFAFTPPPGAKKVDSFFEDVMADAAGGAGAAGPGHALTGQPAPEFSLPLLDGGEASLEAHRGKDIVILDFWASWCGPCRAVMPILEKVADAYEGKGVVLYAVNLQEGPETIRRFLSEARVNPTVALDRDGAVGGRYMARSIPQTVIIAKDGTVASVHVGMTPGLEAALRSELDGLLGGKSSAEEGAPDEAP